MRIDALGNVTFSSGKVCETNGGIIGIDPSLKVFEGYDGDFFDATRDPEDRIDFGCDLTSAEQIELADYMIGQWQQFKERANQ